MHDLVDMAEREELRKQMVFCGLTPFQRSQAWVWFITFLTYTSFHMSRKPVSIVKSALHPTNYNNVTNPGFYPFNEDVNPLVGSAVKRCRANQLELTRHGSGRTSQRQASTSTKLETLS